MPCAEGTGDHAADVAVQPPRLCGRHTLFQRHGCSLSKDVDIFLLLIIHIFLVSKVAVALNTFPTRSCALWAVHLKVKYILSPFRVRPRLPILELSCVPRLWRPVPLLAYDDN